MRTLRRKKRKAAVRRSALNGRRLSSRGERVSNRGKKAAATSKGAAKDVEKYIERVPEPARSRLKEMRAAIRAAVPAEAVEIISYRIPAFKLKRVLVWYGAFSEHCSLFPTASVIEEFKDELAGFTTSKGTVQFPLSNGLPTALIKKLVTARVAQCEKTQQS